MTVLEQGSDPDAPPPTDSETGPLRLPAWVRGALAAWVLAAGVAAVCMTQASALLAQVQSNDQRAYSMGSLVRPPIPLNDDRVRAAFGAWRTAADSDPRLLGVIEQAFTWHVLLDFFLFAPAVALVLLWALRRGRVPLFWSLLLAFSYLVADLCETALTGVVGRAYFNGGELEHTTAVVGLSAAKWGSLLAAGLVAAIAAGVRHHASHGSPVVLVSLWRLRVQVTVVVLFALLVAVPISGPLDQVPDLLRSTYDQPNADPRKWASLGALVVLLGLVWCSGQLVVAARAEAVPSTWREELRGPGRALVARLSGGTTYGPRTRWQTLVHGAAREAFRRLPWLVVLLSALLLAVVVQWFTRTPEPLRSPAAYAFFVVVLVIGLADLALGAVERLVRRRSPDTLEALPLGPRVWDEHRPTVARTVVVLTAAPVYVAAVGLVRAYWPVVLIRWGDPSVPEHEGALGWLVAGAVAAVLGTLALVWVLVRPLLLGRMEQMAAAEQGGRGLWIWGTLVVALALWVAVDPGLAGPSLGAHGVVLIFLGSVVLVCGLMQWRAEVKDPAPLARLFGMRRNPWNLLLATVFLVAASMDTKVGYHAVLLSEREQATVPNGVALADAFDAWYAAARRCRGDDENLPLALVVAPGGGARGAYWTGQVMTALSKADACGGDSVFAASGVSGGSVGLALWSATATASQVDVVEQDRRGGPSRRDPVAPIATTVWDDFVSPDILSATIGALLFRDVPRGFVGAHPLGKDRAALQQGLWEKVPGMADDFYAPLQASNWRTRLLLNASDLKTGCKVLVSQVRVVGPSAREVRGCQAHPGDSGQLGGERADALTTGAVDAHHYLDAADCPRNPPRTTLSLAGAALLSARFTYVSPIGAMVSCGHGQAPARFLNVADGGYLENTGIHTLLALWQDLEVLVDERNAELRDGGADAPRVVPVVVLVDNHYRSPAALNEPGRVQELTGPVNADRRALLQSPQLEQAMATVFGGDGRRWYLIAPSVRPSVAAPLGWSLSTSAREDLNSQVPDVRGAPPESPLRGLRELLRQH